MLRNLWISFRNRKPDQRSQFAQENPISFNGGGSNRKKNGITKEKKIYIWETTNNARISIDLTGKFLQKIVQNCCCWCHLWQFCLSIPEIMFHLVTFYGKPLFVLNSFQIVVIPSREFEVFPHHSMMTLHIHFHRTQRNQSLLEMIQHHLNMLLALRRYPDNYSVMKYFINKLDYSNQLHIIFNISSPRPFANSWNGSPYHLDL